MPRPRVGGISAREDDVQTRAPPRRQRRKPGLAAISRQETAHGFDRRRRQRARAARRTRRWPVARKRPRCSRWRRHTRPRLATAPARPTMVHTLSMPPGRRPWGRSAGRCRAARSRRRRRRRRRWKHGNEGEDDAVDDHRIQRVQRAHGHGERIGQAVGAEQVGGQRHPHEAQNIARQARRRR
jgi:hypothetical protein